MTSETLTKSLAEILASHARWLAGEGGERVDLRDADLTRAVLIDANLSGADLAGARVNWQSHDLISEILWRAAGDSALRRALAGLVLVSRDWCWDEFLSIEHPECEWALAELRTWVRDGDGAPEVLRKGVTS